MPGRTVGEERDWYHLLKALNQIATNTQRIADALEQPPKESNADTTEERLAALERAAHTHHP